MRRAMILPFILLVAVSPPALGDMAMLDGPNGLALGKPDEVRRFVSLLLRLPDEDREAFLTCLRECTQQRSLKGVTRFVKGRVPKAGVSGARVALMIERLVGLLERAADGG